MFIKKIISSIPKTVLDSCKNNLNNTARPVSDSIMHSASNSAVRSKIFSKFDKMTGHDTAKLRCVTSLLGKHPREAVCIVDKQSGELLTSILGNAETCLFDLGINGRKGRDLILYHGHVKTPNGKTLPVSLQDFLVINDTNIEKIVAFNSNGKQSFLKKNHNFRTLSSDEIIQVKNQYMQALLNGSKSSDTVKIKELQDYVSKHPDATGVKVEIVERLNALQQKDNAHDIIDKFWCHNANKYNLIYFSEF